MFLIFRLLRHKPFQKYLAVAHLAPHERTLLLLNAVCQRWTLKAPLYLNKLFKFFKKATVKICKLIQGRTLGSHVVFHISMLSITKCISFPLFHVILSLLAGCVLLSDDEIVPARPVLSWDPEEDEMDHKRWGDSSSDQHTTMPFFCSALSFDVK